MNKRRSVAMFPAGNASTGKHNAAMASARRKLARPVSVEENRPAANVLRRQTYSASISAAGRRRLRLGFPLSYRHHGLCHLGSSQRRELYPLVQRPYASATSRRPGPYRDDPCWSRGRRQMACPAETSGDGLIISITHHTRPPFVAVSKIVACLCAP